MKLIFQIELSTTLCWLCYYFKIRNWYLLLIHLWRPFYDMHMKWCNIYVYKCNQRSKTNNLTHLLCHLNRYLNLTPMWPLSHNSTKLIQKYVKLYIFVISKQRATIWYTTRPCWLILKVFPYVNFDLLFLKMLNCYDFASFGFEIRRS